MEIPKFGHHFEICIDVENMKESVEYYQRIGFDIYTGGNEQGWCTLTDGLIYLALFPNNFIKQEFGVEVLFNYRGGNVSKITDFLISQGIKLSKNSAKSDGTGDTIFQDPNGYKFYIDTSPEEERIDE